MQPTLQLPILGNPHGRIFQSLQLGEDPAKVLLMLLRQYGDLVPKKGTVAFTTNNLPWEITYAQVSSGNWIISDPTPGKDLQDLPIRSTGADNPTLY